MYITSSGEQLRLSGATNAWSVIKNALLHTQTGTSNNDVFYSVSGDTDIGGAGDDSYYIWTANNTIVEKPGEGVDTVYAAIWSPYTLAANVENLVLSGDGAKWGYGNALSNIIQAGTAGAFLDGKGGNDVLVGGSGRDVFNIAKGNGSDTIEQFDASADQVRLDGYGVTSYGALKGLMSQVGADVKIALPNGESLTIRDTSLSSLDASDFAFANTSASQTVGTVTTSGSLSRLSGPASVATSNGWIALNNTWGSSTLAYGTSYTVGSSYKANDLADGTTFTWSYPTVPVSLDSGFSIRAYPEIMFGNAPYSGVTANAGDTAHVFPIQVSAITGLTLTHDVSFSGDTRGYDVAYDLFLTSTPTGGPETITNEVMIWLHQGDFSAFGDRIGTYQDGSFAATVYYNADTHYTAIVANGDTPTGTLDVAKLLKYLQDKGIVSSSEYFRDVELGAEVVSGTGSLTVNSLTITAQTTNADGSITTKTVTGAGTTVTTSDASDVYRVSSATDKISAALASTIHTVVSTSSYQLAAGLHVDTLKLDPSTGTQALNVTGNELANTLIGNDGNNQLNGWGGGDTLIGGKGDDVYIVNSSKDVIVEKAGEGNDTIVSFASYTLGKDVSVETMMLSGTQNLNLTANDLGMKIYGNAGDNILTGGAGNDTIIGNGGADTLIGGKGDDIFIVDNAQQKVIENAGEGTDTVLAKASYTLAAGQEIERLQTFDPTATTAINLTGNDLGTKITGNAGANILTGGAGNDTIIGNGGADTLIGGKGDDIFIVDNAQQKVVEKAGEGTDTVLAKASYTLAAGQEIEKLQAFDQTATTTLNLTGNEFGNYIVGNAGNGLLDGGAGNDILVAGSGASQLRGGAGADVFVFYGGDTHKTLATAATILDFSHDQGDKIDLSRIDANANLAGDQAFVLRASGDDHIAGTMWLTHSGNVTDLNLDTNGDGKADYMIHVLAQSTASLVASDFVM